MKSASQITLSKSWWKKEAPDGLRKSGPAFEKVLDDVAKAGAALGGARAEAALKAYEGALDKLAATGKQVAAEAKELEKKAKDKKAKADLANTVAVMGKPLAKEIAAARAEAQAGAETAADAEEAGQFVDPVAHAAFIKKWAPRIKRGQVSFAVGLPSNQPEEMRLNFHATKAPRGLAGVLRKEAGAKKFTFGQAGTERLAEEHGEEGVGARTLCLHLEGRRIPALAKRVRLMLKKLGVTQFSKVKILEGGVEIDGSDEAEADETLAPVDLSAPDPDPEGGGTIREERAPPTPEPAPEPVREAAMAGAAPTAEAPPAPRLPPAAAEALKARYGAAFSALKPRLAQLPSTQAAELRGALAGYASAVRAGDLAAAEAAVDTLETAATPVASPAPPAAPPAQGKEGRKRKKKPRGIVTFGAPQIRPVATPETEGAGPEPAGSWIRVLVPVSTPMTSLEFDVMYYMQYHGMSRPEAIQHCADEGNRLHPKYDITQEMVDEHGAIPVRHFIESDTSYSPEDRDALDDAFRAMPPELQAQVNKLADQEFFDEIGYKPGQKIDPDDPNFPAISEAWLEKRAEMVDKLQRLEALPERILNFFEWKKGGVPLTPDILEKMLLAAEKLDELTDEELAEVKAGFTGTTSDPEVYFKSVDRLLEKLRIRQETGGGRIDLEHGGFSGIRVATFNNSPVVLKRRSERELGSLSEANAFARRLKGPAAVMLEDGHYVAYESDVLSYKSMSKMTLAEAERFKEYGLNIRRDHSGLQTLITSDDYVIDMRSGLGVINRAASLLDPYEAQLVAFGPGFEYLDDKDAFLEQFELVMRDSCYAALAVSEREAQKMKAELEGRAMTPAAFERLKVVSRRLDKIEERIATAKTKHDGLVAAAEKRLDDAEAAIDAAETEDPTQMGANPDLEDARAAAEEAVADAKAARDTEIGTLESLKTTVVEPFPLALRLEPARRRAMAAASAPPASGAFSGTVDEVIQNISDTRANLDSKSLDLWALDGMRNAAIAALGVQGVRLGWIQEKVKRAKRRKLIEGVALAALSIGLAVGAAFATGGVALVLIGASIAVGTYDAVKTTQDYFMLSAAAGTALDPTGGLLDPELVPHWGWVAVAWGGVVLDGFDAVKAIRALVSLKGLDDAADLARLSDEDWGDMLRHLGIDDAKHAEYTRILKEAVNLGGVRSVSTQLMSETAFDARFGSDAAEAVTLMRHDEAGNLYVEIVARAGASPDARNAAIKEEMAHLIQITKDPELKRAALKLTEDQLDNWATKTVGQKLEAFEAQLTIEARQQADLVAEITERQRQINIAYNALLETVDEADPQDLRRLEDMMEDVADELAFAEADQAHYASRLDEVKKAMDDGGAPSWIDDVPPPRLFKTEHVPKRNQEALDALGLTKDDLPDGHFFRQKNTGDYELVRFRKSGEKGGNWVDPVNPDTGKYEKFSLEQRVNPETNELEWVVRKIELDPDDPAVKLTAKQRRERLTAKLEGKETFPALDDMTEAMIPENRAQCKYYEKAFKAISDGLSYTVDGKTVRVPAFDIKSVVAGIEGATEASFPKKLRHAMRDKLVAHITDHVPKEDRIAALKGFIETMPDQTARGELFTAFRAATMSDPSRQIQRASRASGELTIRGTTRRGDDIVSVAPASGSSAKKMAKQRGPKEPGDYLVEDKSSAGAFDLDQLKSYSADLASGSIKTGTGDTARELKGLAYFFPDKAAAQLAVDQIKTHKLSSNIHVAYYDSRGRLLWLR